MSIKAVAAVVATAFIFALLVGSEKGGNTMLVIKADDTYAEVVSGEVIPSGTINSKTVVFQLDEHWDGYSVTATFIGSDQVITLTNIESGKEYFIPWECLVTPGSLKIILYGVGADNKMPVVFTYARIEDSGVVDGVYPSDPTPDVYQQILDELQSVKELYNKAWEDNVNYVEARIGQFDRVYNDMRTIVGMEIEE